MQRNYHFVKHIPVKCFNKLVQSSVNARRGRRRESKLKCWCGHNETARQQLARLSNYGS